ncbi:Degradation enzyme regulation protein DegQ [Bacillus sp. SA1-12]|nr:DegQ family regulator [Bacillus sp. SA1-12]KKI91187.1 Degradation enzyme regulation protein DegQ [Bacillus sp. SA1-12]
MDLREIDKMIQMLERIEKEIQETKKSLHLILNTIDKYDKFAYLKIS